MVNRRRDVPILGAEFVVMAGDLTAYADAGHLVSKAGLIPVPRHPDRRTGNLCLSEHYGRGLRRVFCSVIRDGPNQDFYLKYVHAVIALTPPTSLWALLRDDRVFSSAPPVAQAAWLRH